MIRALAAVRPEVTELLSYVYLSGDQLGSPFIEALVEHLGEWRVDLTVASMTSIAFQTTPWSANSVAWPQLCHQPHILWCRRESTCRSLGTDPG